MIGSGVYAAVEASRGNTERATELGRGMGRATGSALLGGGFLRNVPVFHELATAGDSLGDVIGSGDTSAAEKRWENYAENSVIGSGVYAAVEASKGNIKRAEKLGKNMGKATLSAGVTVAAVGATIVTGGAAAPFGAAAAAGAGAVIGAGVGAGATAAEQAIRGEKIKAGDVVAAGLMGGVGGGIGGAMAGRAAAAADVANLAEVDAVAAQMAAGEIHPSILAEMQAAEAAGAAEMAAMEAAGVGEANAAAAQIEAGGAALVRRGAPSSLEGSAVGSNAVSIAGSVASRASSTGYVTVVSSDGYSFISADSRIVYYEQGNGAGLGQVNFELNGGRAVRNQRFRDVWMPQRPRNPLDEALNAQAAHEAARLDAQLKANAPGARRPGMISVVQDEAGNAMGGHSVKGPANQRALAEQLTNCQHSVLKRIPVNNRGRGHGKCAEQVVTQNVRHIQWEQGQNMPQMFTRRGNTITAYRRGEGGEYNVPTPACHTCHVTNRFFGFQDGAH